MYKRIYDVPNYIGNGKVINEEVNPESLEFKKRKNGTFFDRIQVIVELKYHRLDEN